MSLLEELENLSFPERMQKHWTEELRAKNPHIHEELNSIIQSYVSGSYRDKFPHLTSFAVWVKNILERHQITRGVRTIVKYLQDKIAKEQTNESN